MHRSRDRHGLIVHQCRRRGPVMLALGAAPAIADKRNSARQGLGPVYNSPPAAAAICNGKRRRDSPEANASVRFSRLIAPCRQARAFLLSRRRVGQ